MKPIAQLIDTASGRDKPTKEQEKQTAEQKLVEQQRREWLNHPESRRLFAFLQEQEVYNLSLAVKNNRGDEKKIRHYLVKVEAIKEIQQYVVNNTRPNTNSTSNDSIDAGGAD